MKTIQFLLFLLLVVCSCLLGIDVVFSCDSEHQTLLNAKHRLTVAEDNLKRYETQASTSLWDVFWSERNDRDNVQNEFERQDSERGYLEGSASADQARQEVASAQDAYNAAYTNYHYCLLLRNSEDITGACGHTYQRIDESSHAWDYFGCGHAGYMCQPGIHYLNFCTSCRTFYYYCEDTTCSAGSTHY